LLIEKNGLALGEAKELCGAVGAATTLFIQAFKQLGGEHLFSEVALIQLAAQDQLIDILQLGQGELCGQEGIGDTGVAQLGAEPAQRELDHVGMVKGQGGKRIDRPPLCLGGIGSGTWG
jgi:hypothetical protein